MHSLLLVLLVLGQQWYQARRLGDKIRRPVELLLILEALLVA